MDLSSVSCTCLRWLKTICNSSSRDLTSVAPGVNMAHAHAYMKILIYIRPNQINLKTKLFLLKGDILTETNLRLKEGVISTYNSGSMVVGKAGGQVRRSFCSPFTKVPEPWEWGRGLVERYHTVLVMFVSWERVSPCSPGWPGTHRDPPTSAGIKGKYTWQMPLKLWFQCCVVWPLGVTGVPGF